MKKVLAALMTVAAVATAGTALAATTANDTINFDITTIRAIAVTSGAQTLTINSATAGQAPDDALGTGAYDITVNATSRIQAKIDSAMPANTTLKVLMGAVGGTASEVTLSATDQDAVVGIAAIATSSTLDYTFSALATAGVVSGSRTVTYTVAAP